MTALTKPHSKTYCSLAWTHQFIGPGGDIKPCCRFQGGKIPVHAKKSMGRSLGEMLRQDFMDEVRTKMLRGERIEGCTRCYEEESAGKKQSLREYYNSLSELHSLNHGATGKPELRYIEIGSSDTCNSACVMCGPAFSTKWSRDYAMISGEVWARKIKPELSALLPDQDLLGIRHVKFTGGEPLITTEYTEFLRRLVELGKASDIYLNYSTNMTVVPDHETIELWKKFQKVEIAASIDGFAGLNGYVRYPTKWDQVERVTKEILSLSKSLKIRCGLRATISVYNIHGFRELANWWAAQINRFYYEQFSDKSWLNATHVTDPAFLSPTVIPFDIKREISETKLVGASGSILIDRICSHLSKHMHSADRSELLPDLAKFTYSLEQLRGNSLQDHAPELNQVLSKYKEALCAT
jgi:hypothetical protein